MERNRWYHRWQRRRAIRRKQGILRRIGGRAYEHAWTGGQPGRLAKRKIHCSCWMCRNKSWERPRCCDVRKRLSAAQQMEELAD